MTIKKQKSDRDRSDERRHIVRDDHHLAEKHMKNAFKGRSFNQHALTDEDLDELGFDDESY
jgi:hypothetical protein